MIENDENWKEQDAQNSIWLPKVKGEVLQGEVVEIREGAFGKMLLVHTPDGVVLGTPSHRTLQARIGNLKVGDTIAVSFEGQELPKVKGRSPTNLYRVFVRDSE